MDRQRTFDDLTSQQRWKLQALKAELSTQPIAETISECIRLQWLGREDTEEARENFRRAYSAGRAAQLVLSYLKYLEDVNSRRKQLGVAIHEKLHHPYPTSKEEIEAYVAADLDAMEMAGRQEILLMDFANTCIQILGLLKKATEGSDYQVPQEDLDYLDHYRPLRDHYAHIYNRLPGGSNAKEVVTEIDDERGFQIIIGFEIDDQDRVVLEEKRIEVNDRGAERVLEIGKRNLAALSPSAIAGLHQHFVQHPDDIPPPSAVRRGSLTRAARDEERGSRGSSVES